MFNVTIKDVLDDDTIELSLKTLDAQPLWLKRVAHHEKITPEEAVSRLKQKGFLPVSGDAFHYAEMLGIIGHDLWMSRIKSVFVISDNGGFSYVKITRDGAQAATLPNNLGDCKITGRDWIPVVKAD